MQLTKITPSLGLGIGIAYNLDQGAQIPPAVELSAIQQATADDELHRHLSTFEILEGKQERNSRSPYANLALGNGQFPASHAEGERAAGAGRFVSPSGTDTQ